MSKREIQCVHAKYEYGFQCELKGKKCPFQYYCSNVHAYLMIGTDRCADFVDEWKRVEPKAGQD